jgi:gluconate 2-dehydrogenase gamma chain
MTSELTRREAFRYVAALMGGSLSAPALLGILHGCSAQKKAWKPVYLTAQQGAQVAEVAEIMIPRTDTPGAIDVGVPAFIDAMLRDTYAREDQARFTAGLAQLEEQAKEQGGAFLKLERARRVALVRRLHDAAVVAEEQRNAQTSDLHRPFILMMKELVLLGYFTSEVGVTRALQYVPIPGGYHGCIPVSQAGNGRAWAAIERPSL